jgi:hypothetical protein
LKATLEKDAWCFDSWHFDSSGSMNSDIIVLRCYTDKAKADAFQHPSAALGWTDRPSWRYKGAVLDRIVQPSLASPLNNHSSLFLLEIQKFGVDHEWHLSR